MDAAVFNEINRRLASLVSSYPRHFFAFSIIITLLLSLSLFNVEVEDDIRKSFSPSKSRANREERIYLEFYNLTATPQRAFIIFTAKDGGTMLRKKHMEEMYKIDRLLNGPLNITDENGRRMCEPLCNINLPLYFFWKELSAQRINQSDNGDNSDETEFDNQTIFDYPLSKLYGNELFMGSNLFGVQKSDTLYKNHSKITHVGSIVLWYSFNVDTRKRKELLRKVTVQLFELSKIDDTTTFIKFNIFGDEIANSEMIRGAYEATKLMIIGFFLLLGFVFFVVWHKLRAKKVPVVVLAAVLSPFLAATVSFAIIAWIQFPFYSIMCVTPFLILGIGVDDAFIMLQSWCLYNTVPSKKDRLTRVFIEIGPSISITSITNMVAFGIGYLTPTPQMSLFCLSTSIACFVDYILTFTLFAPVLYINSGDEQCYIPAKKSIDQMNDDFIHWYSKFICSWKGKILALLFLILLYSLSIFGVMTMKSTFEPAKAFPSDSPLASSLNGVKLAFSEFSPLQIIVNKAPNISDQQEYSAFYEMVTSLESVPNSYGRQWTLLFLKAYEMFDQKIFSFLHAFGFSGQNHYIPSYDNLGYFLRQIRNPPMIKTKQNENGIEVLSSFIMTIVAHNLTEWANRAIYVDQCRSIVNNYPQFNSSIRDGDAAILDLILTVKMDLVGSIAVTVFCMAIVCIFFIVDKIGVFVVTLIISSICFTLVGSLSWWGADMDPVTMVDVLIATGFSVDYTAHIAFKFYKVEGSNHQRIKQALQEMSGPMLQAGISTVLCMLPLIFVPTYAILAFAKTVFLVVALGLIHGIFILPVLLTTLSYRRQL